MGKWIIGKQFKKFLLSLNVVDCPVDVKKIKSIEHGYIVVKNRENAQKLLDFLNGYTWKGRKLTVKVHEDRQIPGVADRDFTVSVAESHVKSDESLIDWVGVTSMTKRITSQHV